MVREIRVNSDFVDGRVSSRMIADMQFAFREWMHSRRMQRHAVAILVTIAVFAYLGPFGTATRLDVIERVIYWGVNIGVNWGIALGVVPAVVRFLKRAGIARRTGFVIGALASAVPGTGIVVVLEWWINNVSISLPFLGYLYSCVAVVYVVLAFLAIQLIEVPLEQHPDGGEPASESDGIAEHSAPHSAAPFLSRLPSHLGSDLHHLRMQDHYVEAHTGKGSELILLRFRDALREVEGLDGLQVHRSHWVARTAVVRSYRRKGRVFLELGNGSEVPVSRSFVPVLAERGWI